jgi:hypothetical protein
MNATENAVSQNHANVLEMMAESVCMGTKQSTDIGSDPI